MDLFIIPIPKDIAASRGFKIYYTNKPCKHNHVCGRYVSDGRCVVCSSLKGKRVYQNNREEYIRKQLARDALRVEERAEYQKEYYKQNRDKFIETASAYYESNKEYISERNKKFYQENRQRILEEKRRWAEENRETVSARNSYNRAKRSLRFVGEFDEINEIYRECALRRRDGEDVHVDHIVPLQGKLASGLHIPANLAIIPAKENHAKYSSFTPYIELYDSDGCVVSVEYLA